MGSYFFLVNLLPAIPSALGNRLSVPFAETAHLIRRNVEQNDAPLVDLSLLFIDTCNYEFLQQGWDLFIPGGTLSLDKLRAGRGLPFFIQAFLAKNEQRERRHYIYDDLWERYFAYAYSLAAEKGCKFLVDYLSFEVRLRNGLVALRDRRPGEDVRNYQVLPWMGSLDLALELSEINREKGPLSAEMFLDEKRLMRINDCEGTDPFSLDAVLAFLEKYRIFSRWDGVYRSFDHNKIFVSGG